MPNDYFQKALGLMGMGNQNITPQATPTPQAPGLQQRDPNLPQNQLYDYLTQQYQQQPQGGGFGDIRAEEMRKFQQDILPGIRQQVSSSGLGGQHSSANVQMPMQAGMDLSTRLAGLRDQFEGRKEQRNLDRLAGLSNLYGGQQTYGLGRARQRQMGAQSQADLISSILSSLGKEGQGDRFNELSQFYNLSQPTTQDVLHEPTEGMGQGAARWIPKLTELSQNPDIVKLIEDYMASQKQAQPRAPLSDNARAMSDYYQQRQYNPTQPFAQAPTS